MKAVGIRQLKSRLSEYVRLAKAGETILVSVRDEVVAQLVPARYQMPEAGSIEATLDRLTERGCLTRASEAKKYWRWQPVSLGIEPSEASDLLDDLRSDR